VSKGEVVLAKKKPCKLLICGALSVVGRPGFEPGTL
jgi:hypothetical protein